MKYLSVGVAILGLLSFSEVQAQSTNTSGQKHYLMAAMGDSITAGFLAATDLSWFNSPSSQYQTDIDAFLKNLEENIGRNPKALNLGGDAAHIFESRTTFSWATGKLIPSQYVLLKAKLKELEPTAKISAYNVAISGGITSDLIAEATSIAAKMSSGRYDVLKYVTLLIGNNDVCHSIPQSVMKANIHQAFGILSLIKQSEPIHVLMSGIPRIPDVATPTIRSQKTIFDLSCQELRKITETCASMANWATQDQYNALIQEIQGTNELLSEAADDANKSFSNLNVVFSNRLFDLTISPTDLAADCFHPNSNTQGRLSQELWNDQPWFK
jgi:lysophospholipase L1-like esterase